MEAAGHRRACVEGGGEVIRQMIAVRRLDVPGTALLPVVLGAGIPLFPEGTRETALRLVSCTPRSQGALHLVYERR